METKRGSLDFTAHACFLSVIAIALSLSQSSGLVCNWQQRGLLWICITAGMAALLLTARILSSMTSSAIAALQTLTLFHTEHIVEHVHSHSKLVMYD